MYLSKLLLATDPANPFTTLAPGSAIKLQLQSPSLLSCFMVVPMLPKALINTHSSKVVMVLISFHEIWLFS